MNNILDLFNEEIKQQETKYFIFDTKGTKKGNVNDIDFETYGWNTGQFNKVKEGDLFLYRRPGNASEFKKFYFFGAGKVEKIKKIEDKKVVGVITKPLVFDNILLPSDLEDFIWKFKERKQGTWEHFFNQYGMNEIFREDFIGILNRSGNDINYTDINNTREDADFYNKIRKGEYRVEDSIGNVKIRKGQKAFSDKVKLNYQNKCAITGINTRCFLVGSHIIPWRDDKDNRLNPRNGICLSTLVDKAFDKGYITITTDYKVKLSDNLKEDINLYNTLKIFEGNKIKLPIKGSEPNREFLEWHNENIFLK